MKASKERSKEIADRLAEQAVSKDRKDIAMARVKCVGCGAAIEQGQKFCSHCGMQIPDDVFKAHIQIDDTAEITRSKYEEEESKLRQKQMKREIQKDNILRFFVWFFLALGVAFVILGYATSAIGFGIFYGICCVCAAIYLAIKRAFKK